MPKQQIMFKNYKGPKDWFLFEQRVRNEGAILPAGIDEVGVGCLAGPVVAAAVILPQKISLPDINDSKKLSENDRNRLYREIVKLALSWGLGMVPPKIIDQVNILKASLLAMKIAIGKLNPKPDFLLIDGRNSLPDLNIRQKSIVKGDSRSISIAAASILAKVSRDRLMKFYARKFPLYGFDQNKGYGTAFHREALQSNGPCSIHRYSYQGVC